MSQAYQVNGPALIKLTLPGGSLTQFAVTQDGAELNFNVYRERIQTDVAGSRVPGELQEMGFDCLIRLRCVAFDAAMLASLLTLSDATGEGLTPSPGYLIGTNAKTVRVCIAGNTPYNFPTCVLENRQALKLGTVRTPLDLEFYAWPFIAGSATTGKGVTLYDHSTT